MAESGRVSKITATFKLSTPAFIAGADNKQRAELRLPSVIGVLRFWWRALAWNGTPHNQTEADRLKLVRQWEGELFGAAASGDGKGGQGRFIARLLEHPVETDESRPPANYVGGYARTNFRGSHLWKTNGFGVVYLQGLGLSERVNRANQDTRVSLPAGTLLKLELRSRSGLSERLHEDRAPSILDALVIMGLLGGIGARSRRGFGSLSLVALEGAAADIPTNRKSYVACLESILQPLASASATTPSLYSAFCPQTRMIAITTNYGQDVINLHNEMGQRLAKYRGYGFDTGRRRVVGGEDAHQPAKFDDDHTWMETVIRARMEDEMPPVLARQVPERAIFGFPHNYNKSRAPHQIDVYPRATQRRGSPLFLHIHEFPKERPVAVWTLFESRFLPDDMLRTITVKRFERRGGDRKPCGEPWTVAMTPDYAPIRTFLTKSKGHIGGDWSIILPGSP